MATLSTGQRGLQQIQRRRAIADAMQQQSLSFAPIAHVNQGLAQLAQAFAATRINKQAGKDEDRITKEMNEALAQVLAPNTSFETNIGPGTPASTDTLPGDPDALEFFRGFETEETGPLLDAGAREAVARDALGPTIGPELDALIKENAQLAEPTEISTAAIPGRRSTRRVETPKNENQLLQALAKVNPDMVQGIVGNVIQDRLTRVPEKPDKGTTDMQEHQYAMKYDGFVGSLADWQAVGNVDAAARASPGYMWVPGLEGKKETYIEGGPADPNLAKNNFGDAAKMSAVSTALWALNEINENIFDPDGSLNRSLLATMNAWGGGYGKGVTMNSYMMTAMEATLRAETGAAAPEPEMVRIAARFRPSMRDSAAGARAKLALLERFLMGTYSNANKNGRFNTLEYIAMADRELDELEQKGTIGGEPAYKAAFDSKQRVQKIRVQLGQSVWKGGQEYRMTDDGPVLVE